MAAPTWLRQAMERHGEQAHAEGWKRSDWMAAGFSSYKARLLKRAMGTGLDSFVSEHRTRAPGKDKRWRAQVPELTPEPEPDPPPRPPGAWHLVIGDAHAKPGESPRRFRWLGRAIEEYGRQAMALGVPFRVVQMGDWFDMPSLSYYDRGKASGEGARYQDDIDAGADAYALVQAECSPAVYSYAELYALGGNHGQARCERYMNDNAALEGLLEGPREVAESFGWTYVPFLEWLELEGVGYCHYMQNPGNGRAVAGVNHARSLVLKGYRSVTVGHSHQLDLYVTSDAFGRSVQTLVAGCYFEARKAYAGQSNEKWWRGLLLKTDVHEGAYNLTTLSMDSIRHRYGS